MKQVFFKTVNGLEQAASTAGDARFNDLEQGKLGFWCLDAVTGGDWFDSKLFDNVVAMSGATVDATASSATQAIDSKSTISGGLMLKDRIQVVQGYGAANPIASPIIHTSDIVRITGAHFEASVGHTIRYTPDNTNENTGDELNLKFIIRMAPTGYLDYVNGEDTIADLSGGNFQFPLGQFNATNHKAINLTVTAGASASATGTAVAAAIAANDTLNKLFVCTDNSGTVDIKARHAHVIFEIVGYNNTEDQRITAGDFAIQQAWKPGTGNDWQARTDELKARAQFGNYNRMYFPDTVTDFAANGNQFDRYEIIYKINGDWGPVKGSLYGSAIIYETTGDDDVDKVLTLDVVPTAGTPVEFLFGRSH